MINKEEYVFLKDIYERNGVCRGGCCSDCLMNKFLSIKDCSADNAKIVAKNILLNHKIEE